MQCRRVHDSYEAWRERLAEANDPRFWPITAIDSMLIARTAQFWCNGHAALVTRLVEYPGGATALEAVAATGELIALRREMTEHVEKWAKEQGLTHLMITGRAGWLRVHKGWRHYQTVLLKELG